MISEDSFFEPIFNIQKKEECVFKLSRVSTH
jgi:hypothetical protein